MRSASYTAAHMSSSAERESCDGVPILLESAESRPTLGYAVDESTVCSCTQHARKRTTDEFYRLYE